MKVADLDDVDFDELLAAADAQAKTGWAMEFVEDLAGKYKQYGSGMFISDAQLSKLREIAGDD